MTQAWALLLALLSGAPAESAPAPTQPPCPEPAPSLLFHSCWGRARAELLLFPEDTLPATTAAGRQLTITGAYTGRDRRAGDKPNPVGLFIHSESAINETLARMDGVLVLSPDTLTLHHRARVTLDGTPYDLREPTQRQRFTESARAAGLGVLQSHLLVVDGVSDVTDTEGAPRFTRRILFTKDGAWGVYQTKTALTLHDATEAVLRAHAPEMALNLDMGSYDYCRLSIAGTIRNCGYRALSDTDLLSNLLVLRLE
ncbi:MAG: hypothetical protein AAGI34_12505 [Pseudomonadota bacterium]